MYVHINIRMQVDPTIGNISVTGFVKLFEIRMTERMISLPMYDLFGLTGEKCTILSTKLFVSYLLAFYKYENVNRERRSCGFRG